MAAKILIIDDDPRNTFALSAVLRAEGYACTSGGSAQQGLAILEEDSDIGIVLIDMMMPGTDGYEAIPRIRQRYNLPIVAVTAQAMTGDRERCIAAGADDYISKPIDVDRLREVLRSFLKS